MKIFYLSKAQFPSEITHTLSMLRVCVALRRAGHEVRLAGERLDQASDSEVFDFYGLPPEIGLDLVALNGLLRRGSSRLLYITGLYLAWRYRRAIRTFAPDLVYSRLTLVELLAVPPDVPLIYEMHSPGDLGKPGLRRWLFRWIMRRLNVVRIVTTTETLKRYINQALPDVPVVIARLSAEPPSSESADHGEFALRAEGYAYHVGYTGGLSELRGAKILIDAAVLAPEIAVHLVGGTPADVQQWQAYADRVGAQNVFFYGHQKASDIPAYLLKFDAFATALQKPANELTAMSPLKIPQYLAYAKPIVASAILPHEEQLEHERTALLVTADDPQAWAEAFRRLRDDPELAGRLGRAGRAYYQHGLTPERRLQIILQGLER